MHLARSPRSLCPEFTRSDRAEGATNDFYIVRVTQMNGQMAWSSPVWVEAAS